MSKTITGTINITLQDATMGHDASPTSFFRSSQDFFRAAEVLAAANSPAGPIGLVAAQGLELALKAFLLQTGMTEDDFRPRNNGVGHSLADAWALCVTLRLPIDKKIPDWASKLDAGHDDPYLFRYAKDNTGVVLPARVDLLAGLQGVLGVVQSATGVT